MDSTRDDDAASIRVWLSLTAATGETLPDPQIVALLDPIDPVIGAIECARLARRLSAGDDPDLQQAASVEARRLLWRIQGRVSTNLLATEQFVFHEHVLRVLMLMFLRRITERVVTVPEQYVVPDEHLARISLAALALNDRLGTDDLTSETGTVRQFINWMMRSAYFNERPDLAGRIGFGWLLQQALTTPPRAASVLAVLGFHPKDHNARVLSVEVLVRNLPPNWTGIIDETQFAYAIGDNKEQLPALMRELSFEPHTVAAQDGSPLHLTRVGLIDRKPFIALGDGRYLLASRSALLRQFEAGLRELLDERSDRMQKGAIGDAWGGAMEDVLLGSLAVAVGSDREASVERTKDLDLGIFNRKAVSVMEQKAPLYRRSAIEANTAAPPADWIDAQIGARPDPKKRTALQQLSDHVERWANGTMTINGTAPPLSLKMYPVFVLGVRLHRGLMQKRLDEICRNAELWKHADVRAIAMPLHELESFISLVERGFNLFDLLDQCLTDDMLSLQSLAQAKGVPLAPSSFRAANEEAFKYAIETIAREPK